MNSLRNIILLTDSYKVSHHKEYPPGTERIYSYFESRGGEFPETVFFGLQYLLKEYLQGSVVTREKIDAAERLLALHFGNAAFFHRAGWEHICQRHNGRLPVRIKAVPEGTVLPVHNVLMTIENTDPACYWLTNYLESLLVQVWYPSTVATQSRAMKRVIADSLSRTGDPSLVDFKLHDFGFRGVSSVETAGLGGAAHLVNFLGTDNLAGVVLARESYGAEMPGFSLPAAEHSTITSWGREHEVDAYRNMLTQFPTGLVAVVSDSYDVFNACAKIWGQQLRAEVLARDGVLIVRPDSGDPPTVVVRVLELLGDAFGSSINSLGYRVLNPRVRVIQGDGIDRAMLVKILQAVEANKWSADNIAFGSGGGLLQRLNRDTCRFAFKCASATVNGGERDVFKQPVTDAGKRSKAGRMKLIERGGDYVTARDDGTSPEPDLLKEVFVDGEITAEMNWEAIRARAALR
ncbi:MAG TPA: nicotinate phosphoribosyltransferase [Pirellulales bacterium]|jgi:nicotinamide phosphoribosyltransferase